MEKPYQRCGWDAQADEEPTMASCRPLVLSVLCSVCEDEAVKREALSRFHAFMKDHDGARVVCG